MSLKYGLNVKSKQPPLARKTIFDDDGEEGEPADDGPQEEEIYSLSRNGAPKNYGLNVSSKSKPTGSPKPPTRRKEEAQDHREDLSSAAVAHSRVKAAESLDPSIFDYDSFHDAKSTVAEAKKAAAKQDAIERKPKYINNLLDAAERRKRDQLVAREKFLQKEREAEGEEFAGKEKFVTGAYKEQQEETSRLEAEEKRKVEAEEERKRRGGGGMQGFYKSVMNQSEKQHQEAMEAAAKFEREGGVKGIEEGGQKQKSEAEFAEELKAEGINVHVNEEGQITDKRELLSAGLNVAPSSKGSDSRAADHLRTSARPTAQSAFQKRDQGSQQAQRERQTRMLEEQLEATRKRKLEEDEEERVGREQEAKSRKTEKDVSDAKARYLARKAAKERGES